MNIYRKRERCEKANKLNKITPKIIIAEKENKIK